MIRNAIIERGEVFLSGLSASFPARPEAANKLKVFVGMVADTAAAQQYTTASRTRR
jgi:hypothetical protein